MCSSKDNKPGKAVAIDWVVVHSPPWEPIGAVGHRETLGQVGGATAPREEVGLVGGAAGRGGRFARVRAPPTVARISRRRTRARPGLGLCGGL
nr:unnamed protein product [Rangifer tarandus platyrhynchus]